MTATWVPSIAVEDRTVELQQGKFSVLVHVAGKGEPVLFLHGAAGYQQDPFFEALAHEHRVFAPEHPGSGASTGLERLDAFWDLVLYYYDLFDALGLKAPAVVGHSFGGMVAAELAATNPERVSKLVLIAPLGLWRDDAPIPDFFGLPPEKLGPLIFADPAGSLAQGFAPPVGDPDGMFKVITTLASITQFMWPIPDKGLKKRIHRITAPTLLVWGKQDGLVLPVYAEEFAARIAHSTVKLVDGAAHLPHLEQFDSVSREVLNFLR